MGKPTISDLARRAGVSPTTVSHAFSGRRHVDPETRERILGIAREMNYHPSSVARGLRSGRTGMIALASSMPFAIAAGPSRLGFLMEIAASAAMSALTRDIALCLIPPHPAATERWSRKSPSLSSPCARWRRAARWSRITAIPG